MDLFAFICHSDPTKVWIGERELAKREVGLLKMTKCCTVPLSPPATTAPEESGDSIKKKVVGDASGFTYPPKKFRDDHQSLLPNTGGKSLAALWGMVSNGSAIPSGATEPLIAASVAPISKAGPLDFVFGPNLRICPPYVRYVVSSDASRYLGSYSETNSFVRSPAVDAPVVTVNVTTIVDADVGVGSKAKDVSKYFKNIRDFTSAGGVNADAANISRLKKTSTSSNSSYASQSLDTKTMHRVYIPRWKVTNDSTLDDLYVCRDLADHLAPPVLFAQLRAMDYDQLYYEFNPTIRNKNCGCGQEYRAEGFEGGEFALEGEISALSERVTTLESVTTSKEAELAFLSSQKTSLEYAFKLFRKRIEALQDEQVKDLGDNIAELDAQLSKMAIHLNEEFYHRFLTTISRRRWFLSHGIKAGINHGKFRRDLSVVEAYDPFAKKKYVDGYWYCYFSLLSELKSNKDSIIVDLMDSLRLEGALAEIPRAEDMFRKEAKEKRLSLTDVMTSFIEHLSSKSLTIEANTSAAPLLIPLLCGIIFTWGHALLRVRLTDLCNIQVALPMPFSLLCLAWERCLHFMRIKFLKVADVPCSWKGISVAVSKYAHFLSDFVTSYCPSHLGPSLPPSFARLASLFR
uniref:Uncharacterized protein n=1 Tax=Tanacetum cinerariifolium TaxID=118510 RepID=A0A6L2LJP7_TANCI|nr:hypothetical protein [Tanacetum cinerariifolium]